jgi:hypothetical protein
MKTNLYAAVLALAAATGLAAQTSKPLFSEDFESGALDANEWSQEVTGTNVISVQQYKAAHGQYALLAHCPAGAQRTYALIVAKGLPEALRHHQFGRAYIFITPKMPDQHTVFLTAGTSGFPKYKYEEVATLNGKFQLTFVDQVNGGEDWHTGGNAVPVDRWFLLEWEFNDQPDSATVWVDGVKVYNTPFTVKATGATTDLVGGFTDVAFGFRLWGAAPNAFDVYYDDIAIDAARVGPVK